MTKHRDIEEKQRLLLNSIIKYNEEQNFKNLSNMAENLKIFAEGLLNNDEFLLSSEELELLKKINDGSFVCCSVDTIIQIAIQCYEILEIKTCISE